MTREWVRTKVIFRRTLRSCENNVSITRHFYLCLIQINYPILAASPSSNCKDHEILFHVGALGKSFCPGQVSWRKQNNWHPLRQVYNMFIYIMNVHTYIDWFDLLRVELRSELPNELKTSNLQHFAIFSFYKLDYFIFLRVAVP